MQKATTIDALACQALAEKTLQGATNKMLELIFQNPKFFGYANLDEDGRSSFLLSLGRALPHMLFNYNKEQKDLVPYLWSLVRLYKKSWDRGAAKQRACSDSLTYCYHLEAESLPVAEDTSDYKECFDEEVLPKQSRKKLVRDMLLVLGIKNCMLLSDRHITRIAALTGVSEETLLDYIQQAKDTLFSRLNVYSDQVDRRNEAFFLKTRYRIELDRMNPESSQFHIVKKKFDYQCRILDSKNQQLRSHRMISPTNVAIGGILGMPQRRITRLLELARTGRLAYLIKKEGLDLRQDA